MSEKTIEALVEGGKASAGPPLGPALGPLGVNIGDVINAINEKTKDFAGMKIPVKVIVDGKNFDIKVGTPPVSALIKKEANLNKLSSNPKEDKVADLKIEQIIKIAKAKKDGLNSVDMKSSVKEIVGSCVSYGILVEGKDPKIIINEINEGKYDDEIIHEKTELSAEELKKLEEEKKKLAEEREKHLEEMKEKANEIINQMKGAERYKIIAKMEEEGVSKDVINELLPKEGETKEAKVKEEETKEKTGEEKK